MCEIALRGPSGRSTPTSRRPSWQTAPVNRTDLGDLYAYLFWLKDRALEQASTLPDDTFTSPEEVVYRDLRATLVHELDVERSWRLRLAGAAGDEWDVTLEPDDYPDAAAVREAWRREQADAGAWLNGLTDEALSAPVTVNGLDGFALSTYLVHVVMHGVESFSAAAILLHRAGSSMGDVGFLDFRDVAATDG